jgi:uracil-DNA glycosylase family 4
MNTLLQVRESIIACERCSRLRAYCQRIGREKRAAFRGETYWAKPVPGFGDPEARVLVIGLAPAAHGANRTGRNFTGDGAGGSGDFLMAAMHANGFANQPTSRAIDDGLELHGVWIAAAVRCAPPDNKPTPREIENCHPHLIAELEALPAPRVYVALGRIAFDAVLQLCARRHPESRTNWRKKPAFEHGAIVRLPATPPIVCSYHPSRQNTNTGRLTPAMLRDVFRTARRLATK